MLNPLTSKINVTEEYYYILAKKVVEQVKVCDSIDERFSLPIVFGKMDWYELLVDVYVKVNRKEDTIHDIHIIVQSYILVDMNDNEINNNFIPFLLKKTIINLL